MKVLHICTYYVGNKLYKYLTAEISRENINQVLYIPIRDCNHVNQNMTINKKIEFYYDFILNKTDKILYFKKIRKQAKRIEKTIISNGNIDILHAHTLFSDGGSAYNIYKKYGIEYILNVRNTDVNVFLKYGFHLKPFIYKVLKNSKKIIFISYAYREKFLSKIPRELKENIKEKCIVIPNGINDFWHAGKENNIKKYNTRLVFIGNINKNKNLLTILKACGELNKNGKEFSLDVIGKGPEEQKCKNITKKLNIEEKVNFHGYIESKERIKEIMMKSDVFIMPSLKETFGVVYIEALSVGLPIIYTKNQGVDGYFSEGEVGYAVNPKDINEIINSLFKIEKNYKLISARAIKQSEKFSWGKIAKEYINIYNH